VSNDEYGHGLRSSGLHCDRHWEPAHSFIPIMPLKRLGKLIAFRACEWIWSAALSRSSHVGAPAIGGLHNNPITISHHREEGR
jgi:hypothetical protein